MRCTPAGKGNSSPRWGIRSRTCASISAKPSSIRRGGNVTRECAVKARNDLLERALDP